MTIATASNNAPTVIVSENGQQGIKGTDGSNGTGFNSVRKALLDNPLCHLFKTNKLVQTLAGALTTNRATTGTYVDRYGVVKTAAINTLREEKDGWLIEGASTNLLTYSDSTVAQLASSSGVTDAASFAQFTNGIQFPATNTANTAYKLGGAINGTTYTISIFVIMDDLTAPKIGALVTDDFQLVIDATAATTNIKIELINKSQSLYRVSSTLTSTGTSFTTGVSRSIGNSAKGFKITGFHQEALDFASSYIPTTTAAATRAADIVNFVYANNHPDLINKSELSYFVSCSLLGIDTAKYPVIIEPNSYQFSLLRLDNSNSLAYYRTNAVLKSAVFDTTIKFNACVTLAVDTATLYLNGSLVGSLTNTPLTELIPSNVNIGTGTGNQLYGHLKDLRIYDFTLNQDEVQYLSGV